MKTRTGFVSNSSSSSFIIFGKWVEEDEHANRKLGDSEEFSYHCSEDGFFVGVHPNNMKDDETLLQFKTRIAEKLSALGIQSKPEDLRFIGGESSDNY